MQPPLAGERGTGYTALDAIDGLASDGGGQPKRALHRTEERHFDQSSKMGHLMEEDGLKSGQGEATEPSITGVLKELVVQRDGIDARMRTLAANDPNRDLLWHDLEARLLDIRDAVRRLTDAPAVHLSDLRAKSEVIAAIVRRLAVDHDPMLTDSEVWSLVLSLTDDIARLVQA